MHATLSDGFRRSHGWALEIHNAAYATRAWLLLLRHLFWLSGVVACVIVALSMEQVAAAATMLR